MNQDDVAISLRNVKKSFKLPHEKHNSLKSVFVNIFRGKTTYEKQEVLKDVSFDIKKGEFFGIVGRNGSGKSTLLKLMAGIYAPNAGNININGKLSSFIELGVGFNPELTGRENVFLSGALMGFGREEMQHMYKEIVDFAELEKSMDQKLKNYSSGMQVRLAFSIAIRAKADILLVDEVLAVGDAIFQQKCYDYFDELKKSDRTVVFISHDLGAIQSFCDRAMLINDGKILKSGTPEEVIYSYSDMLAKKLNKEKNIEAKDLSHIGGGGAEILKGEILNSKGKPSLRINENETFTIRIHYKTDKAIEQPVIGIGIMGQDGESIIGPNTREADLEIPKLKKRGHIDVKFSSVPLTPGRYRIRAGIFNSSVTIPFDFIENLVTLTVIGKKRHGNIYIEPEWSIN